SLVRIPIEAASRPSIIPASGADRYRQNARPVPRAATAAKPPRIFATLRGAYLPRASPSQPIAASPVTQSAAAQSEQTGKRGRSSGGRAARTAAAAKKSAGPRLG